MEYLATDYGRDFAVLRPDFVQANVYREAADIPDGATFAWLKREKKSRGGISTKTGLRGFVAASTNQEFLEELCCLDRLEHLELAYPTTATDLEPLEKLVELKVLKIDSPRNITDFAPLARLPALRKLVIENARHLHDLVWLAPLGHQLQVLGINGSMDSAQRIDSVAPLAGFAFEALSMAAVHIRDKDLTPLATCPNLRRFSSARFAPKSSFDALKKLRPDMHCDWFSD